MDGERFDDLIRQLWTQRLTRVSTIRGLAAGLFASLLGVASSEDEADAKKGKNKRKNRRNNKHKGGNNRKHKGGNNHKHKGGDNRHDRKKSGQRDNDAKDETSRAKPPPVPCNDGPQCREIGHPCEGNQACCCADLTTCVEGSGQGFSERCCTEDALPCGPDPCCVPGEEECCGPPEDPTGCRPIGQCPCTPTTCQAEGKDCGTIPDGCDGTLDCGTCPVPEVCENNECVDKCANGCPPPSDQCHDQGVCDPQTGNCSDPEKPDGTACNDGDACTQTDTCEAGVCTGGDPVQCTPLDQCHDAGTCDPDTGDCSNPEKPDGTACDDDNACTTGEVCTGGTCGGGTETVCTPLDQCHVAGVCDPDTGDCSNPDAPDGTTCTDGDECTQTDTCQAGVCTGGDPVQCTPLDQCHDAGTCDPDTGDCSNPEKPDGTACDDGDACTQRDVCQAGVCEGRNPVECTPLDQCHDAGVCDPQTGNCSDPEKPDGTACNDGDECTQTDTCEGGVCTGSDPVQCTPLDQCHVAGVCDPATGDCSNPDAPDGTTCTDGDACTTGETCTGGICGGGDPVECQVCNACSGEGTCDPVDSDPRCETVCCNGICCEANEECIDEICVPVDCTPKSCTIGGFSGPTPVQSFQKFPCRWGSITPNTPFSQCCAGSPFATFGAALSARGRNVVWAQRAAACLNLQFGCFSIPRDEICSASNADLTVANEEGDGLCPSCK